MSYVTITKEIDVDVDVDLSDFEDEDLAEELEDRGYTVTETALKEIEEIDTETVVWLLSLNRIDDAMIALERAIPALKGISDKVKMRT